MDSTHGFCDTVNQLQQNRDEDSQQTDPSDVSKEEAEEEERQQVVGHLTSDAKDQGLCNDDEETDEEGVEQTDPPKDDKSRSGSDDEEEEGVAKEVDDQPVSRNTRLHALLRMNEMYKSANQLFDPTLVAKSAVSDLTADLRLMSCTKCDFTTQEVSELSAHERLHLMAGQKTSAGFAKMSKDLLKCPECEEWFTTDKRLSDHQNRAHNKVLLKCSKCDFSTKDTKQFARHSEQHSNRRFVCSVLECMAVFESLPLLRDHYTDVHQRINCDKCDKSFKLMSSLFEHNKRMHSSEGDGQQPVLQCPVCGHKYNCRTRYEKHVLSHSASNRLQCTHCELSFEKHVALEVHVNRDHKNCRPYDCQICGQQFYANEKLMNHLSNKHKIAVYACDKCDYKTNSKYKMERHRVVHNPDRYKCDVKGCYLIFETKYNLTIHKKIKHQIDESDDEGDSRSNTSMADRYHSNHSNQSNGSQSDDSMNHSVTNSVDNSKQLNMSSKASCNDNSNDNTRDYFSVADYLEINLKSGDNDEEVIEVSDESDDEQQEVFNKNPVFGKLFQMQSNSLTLTPVVSSPVTAPVKEGSEEDDVSDSDDDLTTGQLQCCVDGCTSVLTTGRELREHMQSQHKLIKCRKCEKCFQSFSGLYKHKRRYHRSQGQIVCQFCDKKFFYQTSYEKHIEGHHKSNDKPLAATAAKQRPLVVVGSQSLLRKPVLKSYLCYDCDQEFAQRDQYLRHVAHVHSIDALSKRAKIEITGRLRTEGQPLLGESGVNRDKCEPHPSDASLTKTTPEETIRCLIGGCDMTFASNQELNEHMRHKHDLTLEPIPASTSSVKAEPHEDSDRSREHDLVESNVISIDGLRPLKVKEEPNDGIADECNQNFNLFTEFLAKNFGIKTQDNYGQQLSSRVRDNAIRSTRSARNDNNSCNSSDNYNPSLICFECNHSFASYDTLYRHNNEFHNKYRPKYK